MKILIPLLICLIVASAFVSLFYLAVQTSPTTTIYHVTAPGGVVAGSEKPLPVIVTVFYNNAAPGYQLIVGVLDADLSPQRIVPGIVVSSTSLCGNQGQAGPSALCAITVSKSSGVVQIVFQVGGIFGGRRQPGVWDLNVTSVLIDHQNDLVAGSVSSRSFKIHLDTTALNVDVPSDAIVSMDKPHTPTAAWWRDYSIPAVATFGVIAAAILSLLILRRKSRITPARSGSKGGRSSTRS